MGKKCWVYDDYQRRYREVKLIQYDRGSSRTLVEFTGGHREWVGPNGLKADFKGERLYG